MIGYKGFDKNLRCRGKRFEVGETYTEENIKICESGLHFCEKPLDTFGYYAPADSTYCIVETENVSEEMDTVDSKRVCETLTVKEEIGIPGIVKAAIEYIKCHIDWNNVKETNTGAKSVAKNNEIRSIASNTGNMSIAINTGENSIAISTGLESATRNAGERSLSANTGERSVAANTGFRSAAVNTADMSVAVIETDMGAASNTGNRSVAMNIGERSVGTNTGGESIVVGVGERSVSTNTGNMSTAMNDGDRGVATNTGNKSVSESLGHRSIAANTGNMSLAENNGSMCVALNTGNWGIAAVYDKNSVACALGIEGKAKGEIGSWLVLSEWKETWNGFQRVSVKLFEVDGERIKANVYYMLKDGEAVEADKNCEYLTGNFSLWHHLWSIWQDSHNII